MYEEVERFHEEARSRSGTPRDGISGRSKLPALRRLGVRSHRGVVTLRGRRADLLREAVEWSVGPPRGGSDRRDRRHGSRIRRQFVVGRAGYRAKSPAQVAAPVVVSFDRHPVDRREAYSAAGLDPISQAKG